MMRSNVRRNVDLAVRRFREWTSIFPERLFVTLTAYIDESYTTEEKKYKHISFGGFIAPKIYWTRFFREWNNLLKRRKVKKFHFREFNTKALYQKSESDYFGWSNESRDNYLHELAALAGSVAVPFGGIVPALQDMTQGKIDDPLAAVTWACFQDLRTSVDAHWRNLRDAKGSVNIVYDENREWRNAIHDAFSEFQAQDRRFGHITPGNDEKDIPLQAADLFVAMGRQQSDINGTNPRLIDFLLGKNTYPQNHPKNFQNLLFNLLPLPWESVMKLFMEHRREFAKTNPGEKYYPLTHYPFERHYK